MRLRAHVFLVAIALAACASNSTEDLSKVPPPPAVPIRDYSIVPGQRIGPISLGMTEADLYRAMGEPTKSYSYSSSTAYQFGPNTPSVTATVYHSTRKIHVIGTNSRSYSTPEGISVGSSELAARAAYPRANWKSDEIGSWFCDPRGMKINVVQGVVGVITVWSPGCQ